MRSFEVVRDEYRKHKDVEIQLPIRSTKKSAGYDIHTPVDLVIEPHSTSEMIFTDIKASMPSDEFLMLAVRSSLGIKQGLILVNAIGIIDSDYYSNDGNDGNIGFKLYNTTNKRVILKAGERVLQGVFIKYGCADSSFDREEVRKGGFGSTK